MQFKNCNSIGDKSLQSQGLHVQGFFLVHCTYLSIYIDPLLLKVNNRVKKNICSMKYIRKDNKLGMHEN